jgi:hypothetical protein
VEASLAVDLGLARLAGRSEMFGDDLVQHLRHASMRVAGRLFEAGFRR